MQYFTLRKHTDGTILYDGYYESFNKCLEDAVARHISLPQIDLQNKNLNNINIDGAVMPLANFSGSNLSGANLSESIFKESTFANTSLYNCCMAYADLRHCDFTGTSFGGTLIEGTKLDNATFSTLSCLELNFIHCAQMEGCHFVDEGQEKTFGMSHAPVIIKGLLSVPIILFDMDIKIGNKTMKRRMMPELVRVLNAYTYQQAQKAERAA